MSWRETLTRLGVAVAVMIGAGQAFAAQVSVLIESNAGGYDAYSTTAEATANPDGTFSVSGIGYGTSFNCDWSIVVDQDPQITSTFTLTNLSAVTQQFVMTITLPIGSFGPATLRGGYFGDAVNGTTYTDTSGNSDVTLGTVGANPFYSALVNGVLSQGLGNFGVTGLNANGGPGIFGQLSQQSWGTPIPSAPFGPASGNMQIKWQFSLTGGDTVQTQGFFRIDQAPEPATLALVGLGLAALVAARRRS